jgi:hypothetical protein
LLNYGRRAANYRDYALAAPLALKNNNVSATPGRTGTEPRAEKPTFSALQ